MSGGDWRDLRGLVAPAFDAAPLHALYGAFAGANEAVRTGLPTIPITSWDDGRAALEAMFDLSAPTNSLASEPHVWASFHEPQFTCGFVHFLNEGTRAQREARCRAFVKAALRCAGKALPMALGNQLIALHAEAEENRIDILVELEDGDGRFGAAIEAKFWHRLTKGQLKKAETYVRDIRGWDVSRSAFVVIAPRAEQLDAKHLCVAKDWHAASWWGFLRCFENEIEEQADCDEFRRFRRTIWYHAY